MKVSIFITMFIIISSSIYAIASPLLDEREQSQVDIVQNILQNTVIVNPEPTVHGSGFYISPNLILTNEHVTGIKWSMRITRYDKKECHADAVYKDPVNDIAVLKTDCTTDSPLELMDAYEIGQDVFTVGNPGSVYFNVAKGLVDGKDGNMIRFNGQIDYGSSGGIVADSKGRVIGMVTLKSTKVHGEGWAVSSETIYRQIGYLIGKYSDTKRE